MAGTVPASKTLWLILSTGKKKRLSEHTVIEESLKDPLPGFGRLPVSVSTVLLWHRHHGLCTIYGVCLLWRQQQGGS